MDRSGNSPSYLVWQQILQRMKVCVEAHNTDVLFKVPAVPKYQQKAPQYGQQSISEKRKAETQLDDLEFAKSKRFKIMQNQAGESSLFFMIH